MRADKLQVAGIALQCGDLICDSWPRSEELSFGARCDAIMFESAGFQTVDFPGAGGE